MQWLWCWRCKSEMPMLDEDEYFQVAEVNRDAIQMVKRHREETGLPIRSASVQELYRPVELRYEELTGMKNCDHDAIMHHRISRYGPPCKHCGKPLRTPKAKLCGSCMHPVD